MIDLIWSIATSGMKITLAISIVIGMLFLKKIPMIFRYSVIYLLIAGLSAFLLTYFAYNSQIAYNLFLVPIYSLAELSLFTAIYRNLLNFSDNSTFIGILFIVGIYLLGETYFHFHYQHESQFISFGKVITNLIIISYCLLYLYKSIKIRTNKINTTYISFNLLNLIYFTLNLLVFVTINFLINAEKHIVASFWIFHAFVTLLYYLFMSVLIWKSGKNPSTSLRA